MNNKIQEAAMDTIMSNITNDTSTYYNNTFVDDISCSDHYPNYAELTGYNVSMTKDTTRKMVQWNMKNIRSENIARFKERLSTTAEELLAAINDDRNLIKQYPIQYGEAVVSTTLDIIEDAGKECFGTKIVTNRDKQYITEEILEYIELIRYYKKKYRSIWRTVRNIKRNIQNISNSDTNYTDNLQDIIKLKLGLKQFEIWKEIIVMDKNKSAKIRMMKRKYFNDKAKQTITKTRTKTWYHTTHQMGGIYKQKKALMQRVLYPKIATKDMSQEVKNTLNDSNYTKTTKETADIINEYVSTIGTKENESYDPKLNPSREGNSNVQSYNFWNTYDHSTYSAINLDRLH